jgi:hypothetical protein
MRGMYAQARNMSDFTGVLVRRQYKPGEKYIQLLFKTSDGLKLSISRNPQMVSSLNEGQTYHVEGQQFNIGQKTIIHEPKATLLKTEPGFFKKNKWFIASTVIAVVIVAVVFSLLFKSPHSSANSASPKEHKANTQTKKSEESSNVTDQNSAPTASSQADLNARTGADTSNTTPITNRPASSKPNQAVSPSSNVNQPTAASNPAPDVPSASNTDKAIPSSTPPDPQQQTDPNSAPATNPDSTTTSPAL